MTKELDEHCGSKGRIPVHGNSKDKHSGSLEVKCESYMPSRDTAATQQAEALTPASVRVPAAARAQGYRSSRQ